MGTEQIAVRLPEELVAEVDELVARGVYDSRAAAVRAGLEAVAAAERRRQIDRAIADEHEAAVASLRDAILDEPWRTAW